MLRMSRQAGAEGIMPLRRRKSEPQPIGGCLNSANFACAANFSDV